MAKKPNKIGKFGEVLAKNFLISQGFKIVKTNFRTRFGELDIIAQKDNVLHFIEVKTRNSLFFGQPHNAVTKNKITKIQLLISQYLKQKQTFDKMISIDVVSIKKVNGEFKINFFENITKWL